MHVQVINNLLGMEVGVYSELLKIKVIGLFTFNLQYRK